MIILGWGKKSKKIADIGLMRCKNCNNMAVFELRELSNGVSIYFIPVAKWKKRNYLVCPVCDAGFEIEENNKNRLLEECMKLPNKQTTLEIWNYIVNSCKNFEEERDDIQDLLVSVGDDLVIRGFKKDDISYVMNLFIEDVTKNLKS